MFDVSTKHNLHIYYLVLFLNDHLVQLATNLLVLAHYMQ